MCAPTMSAVRLISLLLLVFFCLCSLLTASVSASSRINITGIDGKSLFRSLRASTCKIDCDGVKIRPVCGTDGNTYTSRCELKKTKKCDGRKVKVRKKGVCDGDTTGGSKCLRMKAEVLAAMDGKLNEVFVPSCNPDGTFAEVQCHSETGYCWCVTKDGRHVPGTSVSGKRPRCRGKRKKRKQKGRSRKRKACTNTDRQSFNSDLVRVFSDEYRRWIDSQPSTPSPAGKSDKDLEIKRQRRIVDWKFSELDRDNDSVLKFKEIRSFARMVRKLIKPRSCAKRFLKYCDTNDNKKVEKNEWTLCLGVEIKFSFQLFVSLNTDPSSKPTDYFTDKGQTEVDTLRRPWMTSLPSPSITHTATPRREELPSRKGLEMLSPSNHVESRSCLEEQEAARLNHREEPRANIYIPRCTETGKWAKAQCHEATKFCWCVEEDKGTPIPGTSSYKQEPNCTMQEERDMKGCPFPQKRKFLMDLMSDLSTEMAQVSGNNSVNTVPHDTSVPISERIAQWKASREKVAEWKLKTLDVNKNAVLERKEWKKFRKTNLKAKKYPRKCRRNFLRFCDSNGDKEVTMTEWKDCMGLNQNYYNSLPSNPHRTGKNPFIDQLN